MRYFPLVALGWASLMLVALEYARGDGPLTYLVDENFNEMAARSSEGQESSNG